MFCMLLLNFVNYVLLLLCIHNLMFMYSYCYVYVFLLLCMSVLGILFHCVALCIVCVQICTVLLTPGVNPIPVNKYIIFCLI